MRKTRGSSSPDQIQKFREAARLAETNDDEAAFDRALKKVAQSAAKAADDAEARAVLGKMDKAAKRKG